MPKFITYQRPAKVDKSSWRGRPGAPVGKPGKQAPRWAPEAKSPDPGIRLPGIRLPGAKPPGRQ